MPENSALSTAPDTTHVWLVHPVGLSDLGLCQPPGGPSDEDRQRAHARLDELRGALDTADLDRLWGLVWHGRYLTASGKPTGSPAGLPLPKVLRALAGPQSRVRRIRVVLVAAESEQARSAGFSVPELCETLRGTLTALRGRISQETGSTFEIVDVGCAFPAGLGENDVQAQLIARHEALGADAPGRFMISWGSGATSTPFSAASAAVTVSRPWRLLDYTSGPVATVVDPLDAVDRTTPLAVPYLTRMRLFHELASLARAGANDTPEITLTPEQKHAVQEMVGLVNRGYRAQGSEALRQVAWEALVRWDGTAGFALRRYVIERYREMCDHLGVPQAEIPSRGKPKKNPGVPKLGDLCKVAATLSDADPAHRPNAWLASEQVRTINEYGSAAHDLKLSDPDRGERIARWLTQWDGLSLAEADLVTQLGIRPSTSPATGLLAIWFVAPAWDKEDRASIAHQLLHQGPGTAVTQFLGARGFPMHALVLATEKSRPDANRQREELAAGVQELSGDQGEAPGIRDVQATVQLIDQFRNRPRTRSQIRVYLSEILAKHGDGIGGLLLVPTGPKPVVLAALQEMFKVSAERAIPFFIRDLTSAGNGEASLHLWPAAEGHDHPLLTTALGALDRLELDAAARLLAGTSRAGDLGMECMALASDFTGRDENWENWPRSTGPVPDPPAENKWVNRGRLAQRLELVSHCASLLSVSEDATESADAAATSGSRDPNMLLTRFIVLASTLIENWRPLLSHPGKGPKKGNKWGLLESTMRDPGSPARGHAAVLVTLRTVRNKVPITHDHKNGAVTAVEAAVDVLKKDLKDGFKSLGEPWPESPSPISLLQAAPAAARPWDLPADGDTTLHDRYCRLRERLVAACDDAAGRERL